MAVRPDPAACPIGARTPRRSPRSSSTIRPASRRSSVTRSPRSSIEAACSLLALGRRAAAAPLGANFEPFLVARRRLGERPRPPGADPSSGSAAFGESAGSLDGPRRRRAARRLAEEDAAAYELASAMERRRAARRAPRPRSRRGLAHDAAVLGRSERLRPPAGLPRAARRGASAEARERSAPLRGDVGVPWALRRRAAGRGRRPGRATSTRRAMKARSESCRRSRARTASPSTATRSSASRRRSRARPISRPRGVAEVATSSTHGGGVAIVDVSWAIALVLLALVAAELVVRALGARRGRLQTPH